MKKLITKILKYIIEKVKRNRFIQNLFESPYEFDKFEQIGNFTDKNGFDHKLYKELRSKLRPGWEKMAENRMKSASEADVNKLKSTSLISYEKLETTLNSFGKTIKGSSVLEVGCHSGSVSFALAEKGASKVVGTEFNGYKVSAVSSEVSSENSLHEVDSYLGELRSRLKPLYLNSEKVEFKNDDICLTALEKGSFDVICSWDVLEHIHDPEAAFTAMAKLLKIGGIAVHRYNPFFCLNGGHSMCTLDFPWGHVRLDSEDFTRYIKTMRPKEEDMALSFYKNGVNRMSQHDLHCALEASGMKTLGVIPFTKEQHMRMVDGDVLKQVQANYPNVELLDLSAPAFLVITQRTK